MSGHISLSAPYHETSYGFGWAQTQLPGPLGAVGQNGPWMPEPAGTPKSMPIVGKLSPAQLVIYRQGSNPGVLAALNLLPETKGAALVLSNTLALNDIAD